VSPGGRQKLTKGLLMAQETGAYIVSNSYMSPRGFRPAFSELVVEPALRQSQWERIVAAHADGRLCYTTMTAEGQTRVTDARLTKQLLMSLPTGASVKSNAYKSVDGKSVPVFEILVASQNDREAQWRKITADGANGKTCIVFESKVAYEQWLAG
jgi:hypothetical protein